MPTFFATPVEFRAWLHVHHGTERELLVGFHKRASGRPSITWDEAVDEALCVGWIDGVRRGIDDASYTIRFTPRKPDSNWRAKNIRRAEELMRLGRMKPAGRRAFEARPNVDPGTLTYERRNEARLEPAQERRFRANRRAWAYFQSSPPSYRQVAIWWIVSAKQDATRERRLARLIEDSEHGRTVPPLTSPSRSRG